MISFRSAFGRAAALGTTTALAVGGLLVLGTPPSSAALVETDYGFQGNAYGTRVTSQGSGLESGRSAFSWIACTRLAGRTAENHLASIDLPADTPVIQVSGVQSDNSTYRRKAQGIDGAMRSTTSVAEVTLGGGGTPVLSLQGLSTTSTAWATTSGKLKAKNDVTLTGASLAGVPDPGAGPLGDLLDAVGQGGDQVLQALQKNGTTVIPGLGEVTFGYDRHQERATYATASSFVLRVLLYGTDSAKGGEGSAADTVVNIGHSWARINKDMPAAVMNGVGYGAEGEVAGGVLSAGRVGIQPLPCQGTGGRVLASPTAGLDLAGASQLVATGVTGRAWGVQRSSGVAKAWTEGSVAKLKLGPLEIRGIVGRVNVEQDRAGKVVRRDFKGSTLGQVLVNGESQGSFDPATADQVPPVEIPGVAGIRFFVKEKTKRGVRMSAVVIQLADGTPGASVIRLGNARATLKKH